MKDNKRLDDFLREKLGGLKETPPEEIWENISSHLKEKEEDRGLLIPLWFKIAGVAAVIALLVYVGSLWMPPQPHTPLAGEPDADTIENTQTHSQGEEISPKPDGANLSDSGKTSDTEAGSDTATDPQNTSINSPGNKNTSIAQETAGQKEPVLTIPNEEKSILKNSADRDSGANQGEVADSQEAAEVQGSENLPAKKEIAQRAQELKKAETKKIGKEKAVKEWAPIAETEGEKDKQKAWEISDDFKKDIEDGWVGFPIEEVDKAAKQREDEAVEKEEKGKSIFEEIAKREEEQEEVEEQEKLKNRFAIRPNIAPVYYNSMSGGSATDPKFSDNKTSGDFTMAAGIDFSYAISKRVKVRTGIGLVNVSYNTRNIAFTSSANASRLQGLEPAHYAKNIEVLERPAVQSAPAEVRGNVAASYSYGDINQQFEYFEIPLEIEYAVLDKRFGINIIGGASTLLLTNDLARIKSEQGVTGLGRATNINETSFTTNIGLGFDYSITPQIVFNLEPKFKYQLNGFKGDTGDFKPYFFGVYTGMSFRF